VDNLCHTLVGAAFGEAGLKKRTRYGTAALMISANLADLDVLVFATDTLPVSFRRGWTHGIAAQLLLPLALTALFVLLGKRRRPHAAFASESSHDPPLHAGWLLALSYVGMYSHVFLDFLNTYGVRLLTPFDWRWFYGDAVFIIDPILWIVLGAGIWLSRRQQAAVPSRGALIFAAGYAALMLLSARTAREHVVDAWRTTRGIEPRAVMVGPQPMTPLSKQVIIDAGDRYETGEFTWWDAGVTFHPETIPKNAHRREIAAAIEASEDVRGFLVWSRFPYWTMEPVGGGTRVTVRDMRFGPRGGFSASAVVSPAADGSSR
jgi:inner membrane protein